MKTTKNPQVKNFILDIITMTDDLDTAGKRVPKQTISKNDYSAFKSIKNKIADGYRIEVKKGDKIDFMKDGDYNKDEHGDKTGKVVLVDSEIELDVKEIKMLRKNYDERKEIVEISDEAFAEFQALIANND